MSRNAIVFEDCSDGEVIAHLEIDASVDMETDLSTLTPAQRLMLFTLSVLPQLDDEECLKSIKTPEEVPDYERGDDNV